MEVLSHPAVLLVVGAMLGAAVSSIGWFVRRRAERASERRDFLNSRIGPRDEGFSKILAATNAFQFLKADGYLNDEATDGLDRTEVSQQALLIFEEGINEVSSNVGSLEPLQQVLGYIDWVLLADHEPLVTPGVDEFTTITELVTRCKRVYHEEDRIAVLKADYALSAGHDYQMIVQQAGMHVRGADGTVVLGFEGPELADWLEGFGARQEAWLLSREQCYRKMRRSEHFEDLPKITFPVMEQ